MIIVKLNCLLGAAALVCASSAFAIPVTVTTDAGSSFNTTGLSSFSTGSGDMNGMEITALFSDGTSDVAILGNSDAIGSGWQASFSGSTTYSDSWSVDVTNTSGLLISSLIFSGASGDTVFDIAASNSTPGSASGRAISSNSTSYSGSTVSSVAATYTNQVSLNGSFFGDLYETLILDFNAGLASGDKFRFVTDTDNSAVKGGIQQVSEPGTVALLGLGLAGFAAARRRKS